MVYQQELNDSNLKPKVWTFNVDWERLARGKDEFGSAKSLIANTFVETYLKLCKIGTESFKKYIGEHAWDNAEFTSIVPSEKWMD